MTKKRDREQQWRLVEHIVAALFDEPGVEVQSNVRLPALRSRGGKAGLREIDVIVSGRLAGQRIRIPIECKHLRRKAGSPEIDAFVGKLLDVGLPTQTSIFVSTSGFTGTAVARAEEVGMRALVLSGANVSKTRSLILGAIQSHVYLACALRRTQFKTDAELAERDFMFFDNEGTYVGSLPDFLWQAWVSGTPESICGRYSFAIDIPDAWMFNADGTPHAARDIRVGLDVFALVQQYRGEATWHSLTDAQTNEPERKTVDLSFADSRAEQVPRNFLSERELDEFLESQPAVARLTLGRIRLPKLVLGNGTLWPVPSGAMKNLEGLAPEAMADEMASYSQSAANNFRDFDAIHQEVLEQAQDESWIRMTPLVRQEDGF